jgi:hypothetical protein
LPISGNVTTKSIHREKESFLMKTKIRNSISGLLLIPLLLACFALLPRVQAAPDPAAIPGGNTRDGAGSLASRTTGQFNSAFGTNALNKLTMGNNNAAQGNSAQFSLIDGNKNTALGVLALRLNIHGINNSAFGTNALNKLTIGNNNAAQGNSAQFRLIDGNKNTALGVLALCLNTHGDDNTAVGYKALYNNTAAENVAVGTEALFSNTGSGNIALGTDAGVNLTTGDQNIDIGNIGTAGESDTIRIGTGAFQRRTFIAGISGVAVTGATVVVNGSGQLGVAASSERFKDQIKPMDKASEAILALKPVTFHYKKQIDSKDIPQFGLVAEDVEKVNPDLVVRDDKGEIYTVRYEAVNAMLLNEFLKEHRTVRDLKSTVAKQEKQIKALTTGLQKVSNQLELNKPAPRTVANNQ